MSTVHAIESAVRRLPPNDLAAFRAWFAEYDAEVWDRELKNDITAVSYTHLTLPTILRV